PRRDADGRGEHVRHQTEPCSSHDRPVLRVLLQVVVRDAELRRKRSRSQTLCSAGESKLPIRCPPSSSGQTNVFALFVASACVRSLGRSHSLTCQARSRSPPLWTSIGGSANSAKSLGFAVTWIFSVAMAICCARRSCRFCRSDLPSAT